MKYCVVSRLRYIKYTWYMTGIIYYGENNIKIVFNNYFKKCE